MELVIPRRHPFNIHKPESCYHLQHGRDLFSHIDRDKYQWK